MKKLQAKTQLMNHDEKLLVQRAGKIVYREGKTVQLWEDPYEMFGMVCPMNGHDLLIVPEGDRHKEQYWVFTEQRTTTPQVNDKVMRNGAAFQVQSTEDWGSYTRLRMMRNDVGSATGS